MPPLSRGLRDCLPRSVPITTTTLKTTTASPPLARHAKPREEDVRLTVVIEEHAHLLPSQGPISVFVHHNTLHAFEDLGFAEAVARAADLYDCHPYLPEADYRRAVESGRISVEDLAQELYDDLDDEGDRLIGHLGARHELRMSLLAHPLPTGSTAEIEWFVGEAEALYHFRPEATAASRLRITEATQRWLARDYQHDNAGGLLADEVNALVARFGGAEDTSRWDEATEEAFGLHLLWSVCQRGVESTPTPASVCLERRLDESEQPLDSLLIRFCAAFLDQGQSATVLPDRASGFLTSFLTMYRGARLVEPWLDKLPSLIDEIDQRSLGAEAVIERSLEALGVPDAERSEFLLSEMLQLRGWAGLLWQMETNAEWTLWPAPAGTLVEYVAVRVLLLSMARQASPLDANAINRQRAAQTVSEGDLQRAFVLFQIAQVRGWSGVDLLRLSNDEWASLLGEIDDFPSRERRRIYHQAYERHYRDRVLGAVQSSIGREPKERTASAYQIVCCIDDREESFRRHLEEVDPGCETFGVAGFFGVAMYYRGTGEAHFRPLCPVNVKPKHFIVEEPVYTEAEASRRKAAARKAIGRAAHGVTRGSHSVIGGVLTGVLGTLAAIPLVLRVVAPRLASRLLQGATRLVGDRHTRLALEATGSTDSTQAEDDNRRYTVDEMTDIVAGVLRMTGLSRRLSPMVIICGHGSSSVNNPHAAAYDCGACGGGRGGPNARAFARMANDARVRAGVKDKGITIPETTVFVGAYHNTCDDSLIYYDLDAAPERSAELLHRAQDACETARRRDAHERSRRFESADLSDGPEQALRHVEGRAADLSQVRSECGHATNAVCLVGRREWSRGLFLDRRAFLTSYDPSEDDASQSVLAGLLAAVIPVCGGINLEYYFSRIDNRGYGCGTKLPHNVVSLLGVMDGAGSDLRTGLPWQMVEIHEPMRILFVIETTPAALEQILASNETIARLVRGEWVQLATLEPATGEIHLHRDGRFEAFNRPLEDLSIVSNSAAWYRGQRDHLGFALIDGESP